MLKNTNRPRHVAEGEQEMAALLAVSQFQRLTDLENFHCGSLLLVKKAASSGLKGKESCR
jgi:hypothetical protein